MATKGIYKRGSIFWIRYAGLDGRVVFETSSSDKFREAEALLIQRRNSIKEGKQPEIIKIKNHTFNELITEYSKWTERQRSFKQKANVISQLAEAFGNIPLRRFNTMLTEQYQTERLQKNKPATINRHIATLKHMFTKAVDWNMVEEETLKRIRKVKLLEENNRRLRYLSKEECQELLTNCTGHLKPIVQFALNTGCRKGEILSLKWHQIDLKHGFILLDKTKNGGRREIPINETLKAVLRELPTQFLGGHVFGEIASLVKIDDKTNVVINTCKPFKDIKHSFKTALRKAGIRDFRFHDLRHTFASHLVMAGVDLTTVSILLGHKSLTMTLRYAHLAPEHMSKAVNILDTAINGLPTIQKLYNQAVVSNV